MTLLARLIAKQEGFGIPGSVPTRNNNPGDLRHSPHSAHPGDVNGIGVIDTVADGWADLERQLQLDAAHGYTLRQLVESYAPPEENNTAQYLIFICSGLNLPPETPLIDALKIP